MSVKKNVGVVIDRSGSMASLLKQAIDGANEQLQVARRDERAGFPIKLWLTLFNDSVVFAATDALPSSIPDFDEKSYRPDGSTALHDAICTTVQRMQADTAAEKDSAYLLIVVTDGQENASKAYEGFDGFNRMKALLKTVQDTGRWTVVFCGTPGLEDFAHAAGIPTANTLITPATAYGFTTSNMLRSSGTKSYYAVVNASSGEAPVACMDFFSTDAVVTTGTSNATNIKITTTGGVAIKLEDKKDEDPPVVPAQV